MRRLIGAALAGAILLAMGCAPAPYPKDNPRLTPEQQKEAAANAGNESGVAPGSEAPAGDPAPPAEGGETPPPAEGGG